jgi:4'-phosphopantetheinyl transferase
VSGVLTADLDWSHLAGLDVALAWVDSSRFHSACARAALRRASDPVDLLHCDGLRAGGTLSLLLRGVAREVACARLGVHPHRAWRARARCTGCGGPHGRPHFVGPDGDTDWCVSVSHSDGIGVVAVSPRAVGVDVQRVLSARSAEVLDARLHDNDRRTVHADGPEAHRFHATQVWARKEAYGKALGSGLCRRLADDDLSTWPHLEQMTGVDLDAPPSHRAAVVVAQ